MDSNASVFRKILGVFLRILRSLFLIAAAAGILIIARNVVNAAVLMSYRSGYFTEIPENLLVYLRFGDNYVAFYNMGNIEYQLGKYDKAVYYYQQALASKPPERDEECMIRVNLAFSMCHTIDWDNLDRSDKEAVEKVVTTLQIARAYLTEHECASEGDGGGGQNDDQNDQGGGGQDDQNKDQNEEDKQDQSRQQSAGNKDEEVERARQEKLKEDLEQQKRDLEERSASPSGYEYIDGGKAQGYGDGTLW